MKRVLLLTLCVGLAAPIAVAQEKKGDELTDPVEILKKADDASKAAKFVKYQASVKHEGFFAQRMKSAEGTIVMQGWKNGRPEKFRADAKGQRGESAEDAVEVSAGTDGNEYYVIDHKQKKAYVDIDPAVMGSTGQVTQVLAMAEYVHETPFSDEINGTKQELRGSKKIGDEDCYEVYVAYNQPNVEAVWYFSKKDFLPRAVKRMFKNQAGQEGVRELTVTKLQVQPKLDKDPYKFELPEGYTKTDDFAP